jgi:phospholipid-translocating ATPase
VHARAPLVVIFSISAIKEAMDDFRRYRHDREANERLYDQLLPSGQITQIQSRHVQVRLIEMDISLYTNI